VFNYVTVNFPNTQAKPLRVYEMTLWQERYRHEFATFTFRDWTVDYDDIRPGSPIIFTIDADTGSFEFTGYVHHINPIHTPGTRLAEVSVIGASYSLKQTSQQIYYDVTASDIVRQIAKRNKFSYNIDTHPYTYPQVMQAGLTDAELIVKMAKHCGYTVRFHNAEIYFQSMTKLYEEERENAPTYTLRDAQDPLGSTLYSFTPLVGESVQHEGEYKAATAVAGIDPYTGQVIQVTNQKRPKATKERYESEFFDRFDTSTVANNYSLAMKEAKAVDERVRFTYRAVAEVSGDPTIHPDMPVYINGVGEEYGGYWIVLKTEHKIVSEAYNVLKYTTILHLGSDSLGSASRGADNRTVYAPNQKKKRTIIPNVRQTNKKPVTDLRSGSLYPSKTAATGFGSPKNRAKPKIAGQTIVAKKWSSSSGNLRKTSVTTSRPTVVVKKLRSKGAL
jgi:hypothetical protein